MRHRLGHRDDGGAGRRLRPGGRQRYVAEREYALRSPQPGWAEQDAEEVYLARWTPCGRRRRGPAGRGSASRPGRERHPALARPAGPRAALGPSIIWADNRSVAEAEAIKGETDALALYHRTGCPVHPMYLPRSCAGCAARRPSTAWRRWAESRSTSCALDGPLRHRPLRGQRSGLYDLRAGRGTPRPCAWRRSAPPAAPLVEPAAPSRCRRSACGRRASPRAAWCRGAGTGCCRRSGPAASPRGRWWPWWPPAGPSGRWSTPRARTSGAHLVLLPGRGRWVAGAGDQQRRAGAGLAARAARHWRPAGAAPEQLTAWAEEVAPERTACSSCPTWRGAVAELERQRPGVLFGLSLAHDYRHLARATLEGVAYCMRTHLRADGGGGGGRRRSGSPGLRALPLWLQIVADVLGAP